MVSGIVHFGEIQDVSEVYEVFAKMNRWRLLKIASSFSKRILFRRTVLCGFL